MKQKRAIFIDTNDVNGDGRSDLSIGVDGQRFFTIYDVKNLAFKIIGTACGGLAALLAYAHL